MDLLDQFKVSTNLFAIKKANTIEPPKKTEMEKEERKLETVHETEEEQKSLTVNRDRVERNIRPAIKRPVIF
jgi:hypothetical protein